MSTGDSPPFNVFRALRLATHEIRHSNFLGWLFDPRESHGQGDLFLLGFIDVLISRGFVRSPLCASRADVRREQDNLDLRLVLPACKTVIAIENKLFAKEGSDQLARYSISLARDFPKWCHARIFLTLDADPPSHADWHSLSHGEVLASIESSMHKMASTTPQEIRSFIRNYIDLIRDVYSRRRTATLAPRDAQIIDTVASTIRARQGWVVVAQSAAIVECMHVTMSAVLPPIGRKGGRDSRQWLTLRFHDHGARGYLGRYWRPSAVGDMHLRNEVLRALVADGDVTGFRYKAGSLESGLEKAEPAFSGDQIQDARTGKTPSTPLLREMIERELSSVEARLDQICRCIKSVHQATERS